MTTFQILLIAGGLLLFLFLYLWSAYNGFIGARNQVKTDFADIDVQLKRRAALIENLVEVVREYAKHEKHTFTEVTKARSSLDNSHTPAESAKADNMLTSTLRSLFAVSEKYPDLKASDNFQRLQNDLKETENNIAAYREEYNQSVLAYNTRIQIFPNVLVANLFGFREEELFAPQPSDREDVKIPKQ